MEKTIKVCDRCGSEEDIQTFYPYVGTSYDGHRNETVQEQIDLCSKCIYILLDEFLAKLSYVDALKWLRENKRA